MKAIETSRFRYRLESLYEYSKGVEVEISKSTEKKLEIGLDLEAFIENEATIPLVSSIKLLGKLLANLSLNKTTAKTIREKINLSMSEYLAKYNDLILEIEKIVKDSGFGETVLFLVDVVEKIPKESNTRQFFVENKELFEKLEVGVYIYALLIPLKRERGNVNFTNNKMLNFPFYRITDSSIFGIFKKVVEKRVDLSLFEGDSLEGCIRYSGGSIWQMFQIIRYAVSNTTKGIIDPESVKKSIIYLSNLKYDIMNNEMYDKLELVVKKMDNKTDARQRPIQIRDDECLQFILEDQILFDYTPSTCNLQ